MVNLSLVAASFNCSAAEEAPKSVRLPAIYHVLDDPSKPDKPTITIQEIDRCMGADSKVKKQFETIQAESDALNTESLAAETKIKNIDAERADIDKQASVVNAVAAKDQRAVCVCDDFASHASQRHPPPVQQ